jgi:hypothetical protein
MSYRSQPPSTEYPPNDPRVKELLPPFVRAKIQELLLYSHYGKEEEIVNKQIRYAKIKASIDHPYKDVNRHIMLWIACDDSTRFHVYIGGSSCWITPDRYYISFQAIDDTLLPIKQDTSIWWIITNGHSVYRIHIVPEEQVIAAFPDL